MLKGTLRWFDIRTNPRSDQHSQTPHTPAPLLPGSLVRVNAEAPVCLLPLGTTVCGLVHVVGKQPFSLDVLEKVT